MNEETLQRLNHITDRILAGGDTTAEEGRWMIRLEDDYLPWLMAGADRLRKRFLGPEIEVCAIANVRSGHCPEDCGFCAQSAHYPSRAPAYDFIPAAELTAQAQRARGWGVSDFGVISKGWGMRSERDRRQVGEYLDALAAGTDIGRCASLGALDRETATRLKEMGLENYHHNLETAASFFPNVCTTHGYQENIDTIRNARAAGLEVCAGGILGMGESLDQRIELALTLRELGVASVPLNFLNPQPGTPLGERALLAPLEILMNIAVFRYMLPRSHIRIAGGRLFLRDLQAMIFMAGASAVMIGDYLTTKGRRVEDDLQMLRDLKLKIRGETQARRARAAPEAAPA